MDLDSRDLRSQEAIAIFERLAGLPDAVRQAITDHLWATIPSYIIEKSWIANASSLTLQAGTGGLFLVEYITGWSSTAGATQAAGTLQLGDWQTPVGPGPINLRPCLILTQSDQRKLTVAAANAGPLSLCLSGRALPTIGVLPK